MAIKNFILCSSLHCPDHLEVVSVLVENFSRTVVCVVYGPPNCCSGYSNDIVSYLRSISNYDSIIIMGDFNVPDINWSSLCGNSPYSTSLCNFVFDYNLSQVIQIPTHTRGNNMDIVLTNTPQAVFNVNVAPFSPLRSDHFAVTFRLS